MDAAGSGRAVLLGASEGGPLSMLFAAAHPERAAGLILCGAEVKERTDEDWPWGEGTAQEFEQAMTALPDRWGGGLAIGYLAPSLARDAQAREWLGRLQMNAATPAAAETFMRMAFDIDVRGSGRRTRSVKRLACADGSLWCLSLALFSVVIRRG